MCLVRPLSDAEKRAAAKLRAEKPVTGSTVKGTFDWEERVARKAESFALAGDALQEFCDLAGVPT